MRKGRVEEWEGLKWVVSEQEKRRGKEKKRRDERRGEERGFSEVRNSDSEYTFAVPKCIIMPNFVQIGQGVAEIWPFTIFQDGGRPPSWILKNSKF